MELRELRAYAPVGEEPSPKSVAFRERSLACTLGGGCLLLTLVALGAGSIGVMVGRRGAPHRVAAPSRAPIAQPTASPTHAPTVMRAVTEGPILPPTPAPTRSPASEPTHRPTSAPSEAAVFCHHFSDPSSRWSGGTCSETSDQSSCELFSYPAGRCADQGYPHKCIGNYAIAFWYKDVDCATCTTPDTSEGVACS